MSPSARASKGFLIVETRVAARSSTSIMQRHGRHPDRLQLVVVAPDLRPGRGLGVQRQIEFVRRIRVPLDQHLLLAQIDRPLARLGTVGRAIDGAVHVELPFALVITLHRDFPLAQQGFPDGEGHVLAAAAELLLFLVF